MLQKVYIALFKGLVRPHIDVITKTLDFVSSSRGFDSVYTWKELNVYLHRVEREG